MKHLLFGVLCLVMFPFATSVAHAQSVNDIAFPVVGSVTFQDDFNVPRSGGRIHHATDIMAAKMLPVVATVDGMILFAPMIEPSYGYMIMLGGDDGYQYNYVHLNNDTPGTDDGKGGPEHAYAVGIKKGVHVKRGQHIAYVGDSGNAENTGSHVHFEILYGATPIDPYASLVLAQKNAAKEIAASLMAQSQTLTINDDKNISATEDKTLCASDSLIRMVENPAVYYCGRDGGRYLFQNEGTFFSWYKDFSTVKTIDADAMGDIPLKGTVTYKPGSVLVQLASTSKVYAVDSNGTLRWIPSADIAESRYGKGWTAKVEMLPDSFFPAYHIGDAMTKEDS